MSDQQPPAPQDTAAVAGPAEAPGSAESTPQVDWEKRYQDLQPEYTRTTQELKELQQAKQWYDLLVTSEDPDTRRQAAEALGYELPEDEEPEEEFNPADYDDPLEAQDARLSALEQRIQQEQQQAQEAYEGQLIDQMSHDALQALDPDLSEEDHNLVLAYAINALPPVQQPPGSPVRILPDVKAAYEFIQGRDTQRQKQWAKTKRAPVVMPGGVTASEVPDLTTHEGRVAQAMQRLYDAQNPE
jgi:hypothetical protein